MKKKSLILLGCLLGVFYVAVACNTLTDTKEETATPVATGDGFNKVSPSIGGTLEWRPTANNTKLEIRVTMPTKGWVAVGLSSVGGSSMLGASSSKANIISGHIADNSPNLKDRVSSGTSKPSEDSEQNVEAVSGGSKISGDNTILHFMIPFAQDENNEDYALSIDAKVDFLVAFKGDSVFTQHSQRVRIKDQAIKLTE